MATVTHIDDLRRLPVEALISRARAVRVERLTRGSADGPGVAR